MIEINIHITWVTLKENRSIYWLNALSLALVPKLTCLSWASSLMFASLTQFRKTPEIERCFQILVALVITDDHIHGFESQWWHYLSLIILQKNIYCCYYILYLCHLLLLCILLPGRICIQTRILLAYSWECFSIHTSNFLHIRTKSFLCIHEMRTIILLIWRPTR